MSTGGPVSLHQRKTHIHYIRLARLDRGLALHAYGAEAGGGEDEGRL